MEQQYKSLGKVRPTVEGLWDSNNKYDTLSIVYDSITGFSYISKQNVPADIDISNTDYWYPFSTADYSNRNIFIKYVKLSHNNLTLYLHDLDYTNVDNLGTMLLYYNGYYVVVDTKVSDKDSVNQIIQTVEGAINKNTNGSLTVSTTNVYTKFVRKYITSAWDSWVRYNNFIYLGSYANSGDVEKYVGTIDICNDDTISIIKYDAKYKNTTGIILQSIGNNKTTQLLIFDGRVTVRRINFSDENRTAVESIGSWLYIPTSVKLESNVLKFKDATENSCYSVTIPVVTTSASGFMSPTQLASLNTAINNITTINTKITTINTNIATINTNINGILQILANRNYVVFEGIDSFLNTIYGHGSVLYECSYTVNNVSYKFKVDYYENADFSKRMVIIDGEVFVNADGSIGFTKDGIAMKIGAIYQNSAWSKFKTITDYETIINS